MSIEFLLVLPVVLVLLLLTMQIAFMLQAWIVLHHAAQTAVRSAVVVVPTAMRGRSSGMFEAANQVIDDSNSPKHQFVRRSAGLALAPISPGLVVGLKTGSLDSDAARGAAEAAPGLAAMAVLFASKMPASRSFDIAQRLAYSQNPQMTKVKLSVQQASGSTPATVRVRLAYKYYLIVPFGDRIFGTRYDGVGWLTGARYREMVAEYALPVDLSPIFPRQAAPGIYFEEEVLE